MSASALGMLFDPRREEAELREYLGPDFDRSRLERYEQELEQEFAECGDEAALYRGSEAYLYNLTAFAMTATKLPYLELLARALAPGARVLDYGCGIGSDGLVLLEAGYRLEFAEFDNPSAAYLRWRLRRRGARTVQSRQFGEDGASTAGRVERAPRVLGHVGDDTPGQRSGLCGHPVRVHCRGRARGPRAQGLWRAAPDTEAW